MITVLYISNQGGGAPKSLFNMIQSLKDWVYPIVLFENDWEDYQRFTAAGIETIIVPYRMNMILDEPGSKTVKFKVHRWIDEYLKNKMLPWRVSRLLKNRKIDIVHTNTGALTIGNSVARTLNAKFVWHIREFQDIDFGGHPYCGWKKFYTLMEYADALIGISKAVGHHFHFDSHKNAYILWNAVCSKHDASLNPCKDKYVLYCSATICHAKGLHDLVSAFAGSNLPQNGYSLVCLGQMDESYRYVIVELTDRLGVKDKVSFKGPQKDIKPFFQKASVFVLPSLNEGLGRVVVEAMMYGCPVICRNAGGPTEYIQHGVNGYLFSTVEELSVLLNDVINIDNEEISKNAQTFAINNFSEEEYGPKILKIYNDVLSRKG